MMRKSILLFLYVIQSCIIFGQWNITITDFPQNTPSDANIYLAGSFNQWNPGNENYILKKDNDGKYRISLNIAPGNYQFKFTRGSWATVEGTADGKVISNRSFIYNGTPTDLNLKIAGWEDISGQSTSTASPQVSVLSSSFFMPQFNTSRKIWLYLPRDYQTTSKKYPVLYMHDGQNLFDKKTSFLNEWRVDESMDSLFLTGDYGCIIVGIENGGSSRISEYTPWSHPTYGGGDGDRYVQFIANTLKPYVDENYRTLSEPRFCAIAGSSLGGLISFYAGIKYKNIFEKTGALSSSFWYSSQVYALPRISGVNDRSFIYLSTGAEEGGNQVYDVGRMKDTLKKAGFVEEQIFLNIVAGGKHNEELWAKEFPKMYKWLWKNENFQTNTIENPSLHFVFKRVGDSIIVKGLSENNFTYQVHNMSGQLITQGILSEQIQLPNYYPDSVIIVSVLEKGKTVYSAKVY
ncbi:MAG: phosphonate ABC transporter ATP-binding protein [Saprospiraceae bacterium]|nr:phosphonate ABC transporter ATP-binding protein [Saprospiraceae bacterium]